MSGKKKEGAKAALSTQSGPATPRCRIRQARTSATAPAIEATTTVVTRARSPEAAAVSPARQACGDRLGFRLEGVDHGHRAVGDDAVHHRPVSGPIKLDLGGHPAGGDSRPSTLAGLRDEAHPRQVEAAQAGQDDQQQTGIAALARIRMSSRGERGTVPLGRKKRCGSSVGVDVGLMSSRVVCSGAQHAEAMLVGQRRLWVSLRLDRPRTVAEAVMDRPQGSPTTSRRR
ncbi:hypothetical protein LRS73_14450 [Methylobacterium currus]|uniref:hypothetical protein n=1 Tax=Methylobacterium currus TaxID=2051553 RepID=UPI001E2A5F54|nr:hypothetical protein [Methylobacterium currus]UHC13795.1 hypothetical protein LRS73_14450 [Methylobacterium currus]